MSRRHGYRVRRFSLHTRRKKRKRRRKSVSLAFERMTRATVVPFECRRAADQISRPRESRSRILYLGTRAVFKAHPKAASGVFRRILHVFSPLPFPPRYSTWEVLLNTLLPAAGRAKTNYPVYFRFRFALFLFSRMGFLFLQARAN